MRVRKYNYVNYTSKDRLKCGGNHPYHYELLYVSSGNTKFQFLGHSYETDGQALFLLPPNTPHRLINISTHCSFLFMELEVEASDCFLSLAQLMNWNHLQAIPDADSQIVHTIYPAMENMCAFLRTNQDESLEYLEQICILDIQKITALIRHVLERTKEGGAPVNKKASFSHENASPEGIIEEITRYMESRYMDNLTLQSLCQRVHFTPSYFIRLFKEYKGMTPFQYLNEIRTSAALSYLANNNMSIQEIVDATGYQSIHYFSRLFKQKHGTSPAKWRLQKRSSENLP